MVLARISGVIAKIVQERQHFMSLISSAAVEQKQNSELRSCFKYLVLKFVSHF